MEAAKESEEMKNLISDLEVFDKAKFAYYSLWKLILGDNDKIKDYKGKNEMTPLEKKLFEFIIYIWIRRKIISIIY